jgi:uncharacterized cupin superfamily protein
VSPGWFAVNVKDAAWLTNEAFGAREENFLVPQGECVARIEAEKRLLRRWDFLHCAAGAHHRFVGSGDGPRVLLMVGARIPGRTFDCPGQGVFG